MKWNPELHAKIGTNARDTNSRSVIGESRSAKSDEGGMAEGSTEISGGLSSGSPVSMGGEGQGEQGGRVSVSFSPTGDAGDARNILPRGIEQSAADLV